MEKQIYPKNKEQFVKLRKFAKKIYLLCKESGINPVVYGSFMILKYTKDKNMKVNDIDFYIREEEFKKLVKVLKENKINFEYPKEWHTLQVMKGDLKIEFDSIDFWNKTKKEFVEINFEGEKIKALSLDSLREIYKRASEVSQDNPEGNLKKYRALLKVE
jgi:hypothetical protein